jgi:hypothetical protein
MNAFVVCTIVFASTHLIAITDLWFHTTAAAVVSTTPVPSTPLLYGVGQEKCSPYPSNSTEFEERTWMCLYKAGYWEGAAPGMTEGQLVAGNASATLRAVTLHAEQDLAVLVPPTVAPDVAFEMDTFGARANCASVNHLCAFANSGIRTNCTGFNKTMGFPTFTDTGGGQSADLGIWSTNCAWDNRNCIHLTQAAMTDAYTLSTSQMPTVDNNLWIQFIWQASGDTPLLKTSPSNDAITSISNLAIMLANCTVNYYNATLYYENGTYSLHESVLTDPGVSDGLAGPLRLGYSNAQLLANVQGIALTANTTDEVIGFLNQDLGRIAIGSAAWITNLTLPTRNNTQLETHLLGRYRFAPAMLLIALLYAHAALALVIFFLTIFTRTDSVRVPGQATSVSLLELVQLRLTSPLPMIADHFPTVHTDIDMAELSASTSALDLFGEREGEARLRVGLTQGTEAECVFGVWKEGDIVEGKD